MIRTNFNFKYHPDGLDRVGESPSLTLPDQSMTIQEILNKFASGQTTNSNECEYDIDVNVSDNEAFNYSRSDDDNPDDLTKFTELNDKLENERKISKSKQESVIKEKNNQNDSNVKLDGDIVSKENDEKTDKK